MSNSAEEIILDDWELTTLKDIAFINPRESLSKGKKSKYLPMEYLIPFTRKVANYEVKEYKGGTKFKKNDSLVARITPCLENGKTCLVDFLEENEVGFGSTEYIVLREKENKSNSIFLYYFSISPRFRNAAIKSMTGTSGRQRVQTDLIESKEFLFPPLFEQKAIAAVLSSFDDKIELLRKQNETLEQIAQAIFKEWFVNFNFPDENGNPYKDSGGKMIPSELGEIPEGWRIDILENISEILNGFAFKSKDYVSTGYPIIRTKNFSDDGFVEMNQLTFLTEEKAREYKNYNLNKFDFLVVMVGASLGKNVLITQINLPSLQNQNMWNFRPKINSFRFYNIHLLKNLTKKNLNSASGSAREFFRKDYFFKINVLIPDNLILNRFNSLSDNIYTQISNNIAQLNTLKKIREAILPKLMNGKIRIK